MTIVLCSLYDLGRQPIGLASPAAFLRRAGHDPVCLDFAVQKLDDAAAEVLAAARLVAISVPMHTALRLGLALAERVRALNPGVHLCFYGLYAPLHADFLRRAGADSILGGECEQALVELADAVMAGRPAPAPAPMRRLAMIAPARDGLPPPDAYARLVVGEERRLTGNVEATRGCKHLCRHCPIPPVYGGRFFAVPVEVVLADAERQVAAGVRHLTFTDPDFLNGPTHALAIARRLHAAHPTVTFDATIKVSHLLAHREVLPELAQLGCAFVVSAFESLSDRILTILDKGHTAADAHEAVRIARAAGLSLRPTFVAFTPWTTREDYLDLCRFIEDHDLEGEVDPIQLALRLLIPPGSLLLERPELAAHLGELDEAALSWRWTHPDPEMDRLQVEVAAIVERAARANKPAHPTFASVLAHVGVRPRARTGRAQLPPHLSEPWFC